MTLVKNLYYPEQKRYFFFKIDCDNCNTHLTDTSQATSSLLIERHDRGGLVKPHKDVVEVVKIENSIFERKKNTSNDILSDHRLLQKLSITALTHISSCRPNLLIELESCHRAKLFKEMFAMFFSMKVKHMCKLKNDHFKTFVRKVCKKIPIYKNQ